MPSPKTPLALPTVRMPRLPSVPRNPPGWGYTEQAIRPKPLPYVAGLKEPEPAGEIPPVIKQRFPAMTKPEWATWYGLLLNGKKEGLDFVYVATLVGGVGLSYYSTVDFMLAREKLAFEVQGVFWHYQAGSDKTTHDILRYAYLADRGITLIFLDEDMVLRDPEGVVEDALMGKDRSRLARRM